MKTTRKGTMVGLGVLFFVFTAYLFIGRYPAPGFMNPGLLFTDEIAARVFFSIRLPRALGAILLGAALGGSGAVFQTIFGNPLVDAGFLGVSQGAAFGAAAGLAAGFSATLAVGFSSFAMAILALGASVTLSRKFKFGGQVVRLLLAGLAVSAFFASLLAIVKYVADPLSQLPDIVFWTMGSLASMGWPRLGSMAPAVLASLATLYFLRWRAGLLSLDDDISRSLGVRPELERAAIAVAAATGVAAATAACGIVSWTGLVVPQVARIISGPDSRSSIPLSMLGGAIFTLAADLIARALFPGELPLGIVTALLGATIFAGTLASRKTELAR